MYNMDYMSATIIFGGIGGLSLILSGLIGYIACAYGLQLIAKKFAPDIHPALAWIPIANIYVLVRCSGQSIWWCAAFILGLIPGIGALLLVGIMIFLNYHISVKAQRGMGTALLLTVFPVIAFPWLGLTLNKKSTATAWVLGVIAYIFAVIAGMTLIGAAITAVANPEVQSVIRDQMQNNPELQRALNENPEARDAYERAMGIKK